MKQRTMGGLLCISIIMLLIFINVSVVPQQVNIRTVQLEDFVTVTDVYNDSLTLVRLNSEISSAIVDMKHCSYSNIRVEEHVVEGFEIRRNDTTGFSYIEKVLCGKQLSFYYKHIGVAFEMVWLIASAAIDIIVIASCVILCTQKEEIEKMKAKRR